MAQYEEMIIGGNREAAKCIIWLEIHSKLGKILSII